MATTNTDAVNLATAPVGGVINEDVMDKLYQIDPVERPFIDAIESMSATNQYKEFTQRPLRARNVDNAAIDGQDITAKPGSVGIRLGAYHQILFDNVSVSERAQNVDPIARADELLFQVAQIQKEVRRDEESIKLYPQARVPGNGDDTPGRLPGAPTWLITHRDGSGTGPAMSDDANNAGYPDTAPIAGDKRALVDDTVKDMIEDIYTAGGNPTMALSSPKMIRRYSNFHFTSSAQIATLTSDKKQGSSGGGDGLTAYGSVNVLVTDFGITIELVPDRQYENYDSLDGGAASKDACDLLILDTNYWSNCTLQGYETKPLSKNGLSDTRMVTADLSLLCLQEKASGCIADLDATEAVV